MSRIQLPAQLEAAEGIPIAQLRPDVQEPEKRVARGVVTITWPYSIVKKTIAFLLAEPDFRLRRAKGQVRVEFDGSSAKAVADAALGSGDEITLSLDGVEFVVDDSKTRVPGTSLEWQLRFTERVLLQAKISDSEDVKVIDVDHPRQLEPEPELELPQSALDPFTGKEMTPERTATPVAPSSKRPIDQNSGTDEYASPAFLKRARISYGSLFDGGLDIFDEDVEAKARAKKRPKTGRYSGVWKYASQSPSPEPEDREDEKIEDTSIVEEQLGVATPSRPKMVDDGCQTIERDVAAEARQDPSYWQTPSKSTMIDSGVQSDLPASPDVGLTPGLTFGQHAPMPMFTTAHEQYAPAFQQPPLGPVFGHDLQGGMEPHYDAQGPFHEHPNAYPEAGLDHGVNTQGHYPASFLDGPNFGPHVATTPQSVSESTLAYQDHPQQHNLGGEHHTVVMDSIAEPQQVPWGLTSAHYSRSPVKSGGAAAEGGRQAEQQSSTQAIPSDNWAEDSELQIKENHKDHECDQAALKVDEDQDEEDEDEEEDEILEPDLQGNEEDELEEDVENYGEEYDEYDEEEDYEDEDQENQPPPAAPRGGAPEVISLLSDSEDEDEAPPSRPTPAQSRQMPQYDGSTDEMEEDDPSDKEESEAKYDSNGDGQQSSSSSSDDESEEETSHVGTPTPKPRPTSSKSAYDALELTSATLGDDLETMSPIKLPQTTGLSRSSSRPSSRGDSEMLTAELEKELEEELVADTFRGDRKSPEGTEAKTNKALGGGLKEAETVSSAEILAGNDAKEQALSREEVAIAEDSEVQGEVHQTQPDEPDTKDKQRPGVKTDEETKVPVDEEPKISVDEDSEVPMDGNQPLPSQQATEEAESQQMSALSEARTDSNSELQAEEALPSTQVMNEVYRQNPSEEPEVIITEQAPDAQTEETHIDSDKEMQSATDSRPAPDAEVKVAVVAEVQTEETQVAEVNDQKSVKEHTPDLVETEVTETKDEASELQIEDTQSLKSNQDMHTEQEVTLESEVETEEVTIIPETTVEVDMESTNGYSPDPTDIDMADTEAMSLDETRSQDSDVDMDEMTEEQLIQTQLQEESMIFEDQTLTTVMTTQTVEEQPVSQESKAADNAAAPPETEVIETLRVTIETSVTKPLAAADEHLLEAASKDVMDVDEPNYTRSTETASPPTTKQFLSRSFEEVKIVETQTSQASEQFDIQEDDVQLLTPGGTQQDESVSQSFVETQITDATEVPEANTQDTVPEVDDDTPSETQITVPEADRQSQTQEKPENKAVSSTTPVRFRQTIEPGLEASYEADATSPTNDESSQIRDSSAQPSEAQSSLIAEDASEEVNAAQPSPRRGRGHRRDRSDTTSKDLDPSVKLARASIASRRSTRQSDRTTPDSTRVTRARSQSLVLKSDSPGAEDDSVQLARSAIKSPSRAPKVKEPKEKEAVKPKETKEPKEKEVAKSKQSKREATPKEAAEQTPAVLKAQLTRSLRADVPDCISLKALRNHPGKAVDVIAIATTEPPEAKRAKGGPRGIMLAFNITDHSVAPSQTLAVQIFRPHKAALPVVHPGDAILLRNFSVMVLTGRGFGLRANDGSSWAVFERESQDDLPQIRGPPVELTEGEASYAALLKQWYAGLDAKSLARLDKANEAAPAVGK
ncbi:3-dehydroshikimate dehydratase [Colletotrichum tofieldiae]|nr:3-dehydroshikimate dehydratase [Colletotrichum tofieldiae]GKT78050.1 3-dehydroshikimate dehydratase [Colletotrichum tofieldiae]